MQVGILGSGMVGQTFGAKLVALGHEVMVGTRNPAKLSEWLGTVPQAKVGSFAETAAFGEIIFNCTSGTGSLEALELAGAQNLNGKILIDIANPLDFSQGMPPSLFTPSTDSLGERTQKAFPAVKVVKTLNTMNCYLMVDPGQLADGDHEVFVSGNDAEAKAQVTEILKTWFGWKRVIDLGDISTARGTEMLLPIWLRLWGALGTPMFNFKIVR
ncbi:MAG TPA: NAD(P)-binding domain-containing protein [Symbiobacteriaceae bacterium]|nr:NAD(P)-binding domain-containing protein [Symbiobacteriaceae bacterium]